MPVLVLSSRALSCVIGKAAAEGNGVPAVTPNSVGRRHPAVLKDAGEGALRSCGRPDIRPRIETKLVLAGELFPKSSTIVIPGKTEDPNALIPTACGVKSLPYGAIDLLANESEYFGDTEVWSDGLRISNARHLAARIQVLRKTLDRGIPEGR